MLALRVQIPQDDSAPLLSQLVALAGDRTPLNRAIAVKVAQKTQSYLMASSRHTTANRLGATPTYYWQRMAKGLEPSADANAAYLLFPTGQNIDGQPGAEALARVFGDVPIKARKSKYLTIPAIAATYGRSARSFDGLKFIPFASGARALVKQVVELVPGKRKEQIKKVTNLPYFWLKSSVVLPQDRTLLPSDAEILEAAESGAGDYMLSLV